MGFLSSTKPFNFPIFSGEEYLTEAESKQLETVLGRLFPSDHRNGVPGARDAKAHRYISHLLALDPEEYHKIVDWRLEFRNGLKELEAAAQHHHSTPLAELSDVDADDLLTRLEDGQLEGMTDGFDQKGLFRLLHEHCIKGCFADPRWGGNDGGIMWRWLGWIQPAEDIKFGDD